MHIKNDMFEKSALGFVKGLYESHQSLSCVQYFKEILHVFVFILKNFFVLFYTLNALATLIHYAPGSHTEGWGPWNPPPPEILKLSMVIIVVPYVSANVV